ncbi:hypothetical protein CSA56_00775 [candidate division KSB3 bacterium]|uniref:Calcineurin-like phosphoesterase domain-containing protein n=1 Tax=candidate division KSB3 bacterium TaxID=2044937 RepID=A0A2G6KKR9_9BACT|nr:MAG: hypothetical protein CSA56_00775 [candidate division KSB3 bacterium]
MKPRFIISDLHLGEGQQSQLEDFGEQASENFVQFFKEVSSLGGARVIINGDFIDFPQISLGTISEPPQKFLGTTEAESTLRLQKAIAAHPEEFDALQHFLDIKGNELLIIPGNHDVDFAWSRVLKTFMHRIGASRKNFKFGMVYKDDGVFVTHGHQYSDENRIDVPINFTFNRLNSCWGTYFVTHFFNKLEDRYPLLDNARPVWKTVLSAILFDEILVTGKFAAEFMLFLKNFRIPLNNYTRSAAMGWKPKTRLLRQGEVDRMLDDVKINALRERLQELRGNPKFQREFDSVFRELSETQWEQVFSPYSGADYEILDFVQNTESRPQSRGMFSNTDHYQQAASLIAQHHPDIRAVVMGHTHRAIKQKLLDVEGTKERVAYFNTGTWTKTYDTPWWKLPDLQTLIDPSEYTQNSGIVRYEGEGDDLQIAHFDTWQEALEH